MIELAVLAMLGTSVLAYALSGETDRDETHEDTPENDSPDEMVAEAPMRTLSLLTGDEITEAEPEGEVFTVDTPTAFGDDVPTVQGFNPETDLIAFNLQDLMTASTTTEGAARFSEAAAPGYTLSIISDEEADATTVSLSLFDSADPETAPVTFDIRLVGIETLEDSCVSVVDGDTDLETLEGGERAAAFGSGAQTGADETAMPLPDALLREIDTGDGTDRVTGDLRGTRLTTRGGDDLVNLSATGSVIEAGEGDDSVQVSGGPGNFVAGGAGDDDITVDLGTDVEGGNGRDQITVRVPSDPQDGLPLFLWNQPVEDARFSGHSTITLDDDFDSVTLALAPEVEGHLHRVHVTQESYGTSSSEVYTHHYTLVVWTPEDAPDLHSLVTGAGSEFNSGLALGAGPGSADYESAATDTSAPRVILTVDHGTEFLGFIDEDTGAVSGTQNGAHDLRLTTNREFVSVHDSVIY